MSRQPDISVKSVLLGDSGVGKTCLLARFVHSAFPDDPHSTVGVAFQAKIIETSGRRIELQLWDTAGQEIYRSVTQGYYRGASIVYVVFDLANPESLDSVDQWIKDVKDLADSDAIIILIGNKCDLPSSARKVTADAVQEYAASHRLQYFETSAKTGHNVSEAFLSCLTTIKERADKGRYQSNTPNSDLIASSQSKDDSCC
jgi:small GTP-binding protein